jgi:hypothetical protein
MYTTTGLVPVLFRVTGMATVLVSVRDSTS